MRRTLAVLLCAGLGLAPFAPGLAQNPQPAAPGNPHPSVASPNAPSPPPEKVAPGESGPLSPQANLSDKLAEQNGVLQPPPTGDQGTVRLPQTSGTMPVIPPPGTPGGNPKVVPK